MTSIKTEPDKLMGGFLEYLASQGALRLCQQLKFKNTFSNFLRLIQKIKLQDAQARYYLESKNNFLIESFIRFIRERRIILPAVTRHNLKLFQNLLRQKSISASDYDERIRAQSLQFQIDNYYQPKKKDAKRRIEIILKFLKPMPGEFILDIGCGVGTFAYQVANIGAKSIGIDYSKYSIRMARQLAVRFNLNGKSRFLVSNGNRLPFESFCFDKIVAADFIEHIDYKNKLLLIEEMHRILKDDGWAVISTPNVFREWLGWIKRRFYCFLWRKPVIETRLHFGLISRFKFEKLLRQKALKFKRHYFDESRPILAKIPLFREFLSIHILWKVWK